MVVQMKYLKNVSINDYKSYLTVNMFFSSGNIDNTDI